LAKSAHHNADVDSSVLAHDAMSLRMQLQTFW